MKWNKVSDKLPTPGQEVLAYYNDGNDFIGDLHQFTIVTYYEEGNILENEAPPLKGAPIEEVIRDAVWGTRGHTFCEKDGFYMYDCVDDTGLNSWRRHSDVITHWAELIAPEQEGKL
jgi:hypothetical protein